jgi:hypothetical protein
MPQRVKDMPQKRIHLPSLFMLESHQEVPQQLSFPIGGAMKSDCISAYRRVCRLGLLVLGGGQAVPLTADAGVFWFFSNSNVELVAKGIDGRRR